MSEQFFPKDEKDQDAIAFDDTYDRTADPDHTAHPGDPSIEEILRRALNSGMDDTPSPEEQ